jgi:hypothetical protein
VEVAFLKKKEEYNYEIQESCMRTGGGGFECRGGGMVKIVLRIMFVRMMR